MVSDEGRGGAAGYADWEELTSGSDIEFEKLDKNGKKKGSTCRDQEKNEENSKRKNRSTTDNKGVHRKGISPSIFNYEKLSNSCEIQEHNINLINDCKKWSRVYNTCYENPNKCSLEAYLIKETAIY
ncbi:unnamed protein product [Lepeophtheirus salmonis]|uniref:(salmon louse) hypothetical protein n=1 Tax=Lepeophtheirus salmonis TaxID=72036 RepID=A0A817FCV3_LEPSM|nr:unnamed protein product [Lepeophtheirus salmonis]CAG9477642.1 unnamed protein product [Lepeophtheirus salmonis]